MANTCRPVLAAPVRRLQPSTSFAAVTPRLRRDKLGVGKEPSRPQFATTFTAKAAHGSTLPRVLGRPRAGSSTPSCARPSVRGSQPPLYLVIAGRDEAGEAIGGREPAAPRGDRAREKAWRPVHRFQREPEQSPGPQTEPAFARTGDGQPANSPSFVGIDVSKDRLDVHVRPSGQTSAVARDGKGLEQLTNDLRNLTPALIVLEATGGFEITVAAAVASAGLPLAVVNPRQIRDFARATRSRCSEPDSK